MILELGVNKMILIVKLGGGGVKHVHILTGMIQKRGKFDDV